MRQFFELFEKFPYIIIINNNNKEVTMTSATKSFIKRFEEVLCFYHETNKDDYQLLFVQDGGGALRVIESASKDELHKMKHWRNFAEKFINIENENEWKYRLIVGADPTAKSNILSALEIELHF